MAKRTWQALVLGQLPEAREMFARPIFEQDMPTYVEHVPSVEDFEDALGKQPPPDVILIDVAPHGLDILEKVREHFPVSPVVMIGNPEDAEILAEALQKGLERYVMRVENTEQFVDLLTQVVYQVLMHTVEPPSMEKPSAEQMHRYAQYHHILHPFFVVGHHGRLLYVNAAGERLTWKVCGRSPIIGESLDGELLGGLGEPFRNQLKEGLEGRETVIQYSFDKLDAPQERSVHCTPLSTNSGRIIAASVSIHHQTPPEVERSRTMRAISRFAGGLAHDFNNLLNVVMVQAELMSVLLGDVSQPVKNCLDSVGRAVSDGSELTRQLLAISHETLSHRAVIDINTLLESIEPKLHTILRDAQTLEMQMADELPLVQADPQQVEKLISKLVENAADALDADGGIISVRTGAVGPQQARPMPRGLESRRWVVLTVEDTGPGVRPALHSRIFEPFFTTRRAQGHSGLGLTLVHAVVEQMDGHIFIDSEPGAGTTFTIYLPVSEEGDAPTQSSESGPTTSDGPVRATILLVEDEEDLRMPFREVLVQHGFEVLEASDVSSALELVEERGQDIDAVISDVVMPGGSGVEIVRELAQRHPQVKVVFVSGYTAEVIDDSDSELEVDYLFLAKPVSLTRLVAAVDALLDDR